MATRPFPLEAIFVFFFRGDCPGEPCPTEGPGLVTALEHRVGLVAVPPLAAGGCLT